MSDQPCAPSVAALERVAALGWRPLESARLGGWLLRAAAGFTGRANSVLPLGDPGSTLPAAVDRVERWYGERGLVPRFLVPTPMPGAAALDAELDRRRWTLANPAHVLAAALPGGVAAGGAGGRAGGGAGPGAGDVEVGVDAEPDDAWVAAYHYRGDALPAAARPVLVAGDDLGFVSLRVPARGQVLAIARGSVDADGAGTRWLGVTAVEVVPDARGRGLGRAVMAAVLDWGRTRGARCCYLQVFVGNVPALAMYDRLGFVEHHRYHYRLAPAS